MCPSVTLALVVPGFVYFLVFHYIPLLGYITAFENYLPFLGFFASPWVGFENFGRLRWICQRAVQASRSHR